MIVNYPDLESFHEGVFAAVRAGLCFTADAERLTIT